MGLFGIGAPNETASVILDCYTRSEVPGKRIEKSIGLVQYTKKGIAGDILNEIDGIFKSLLQVARDKGANAVLNVRIITGSYQQQGSAWEVTYIVAYGEAVILSPA
jgi:uncharacterized protein YbjQ (UPF0145 family)